METKLLTEAKWRTTLRQWVNISATESVIRELRERGLIADEPVDPLLIEAREIAARTAVFADYREQLLAGDHDNGDRVKLALAALKRGMEMRAPLTREMVRDAINRAFPERASWWQGDTAYFIHAALTKEQS